MATKKEYKIAELSYLNSISPAITYINGNKKFDTIEEAKAAKPNDTGSRLYIIAEIKGQKGCSQKVRLVS